MKAIIYFIIFWGSIQILSAQNPLVKQWDYRYGGTDHEFITSFQQTSDGGFILGGFSSSPASGDKAKNTKGGFDYWIIKIDSLGNKQWDKDLGGSADDRLYSLQQTSDGGYILGGTSNSGIGGDKTQANWDSINFTHDFWVVKINASGTKQWDMDFGGTNDDYISSVQQTNDGGYILAGSSLSGMNGDKSAPNRDTISITHDFWLVKIDSLGIKQWDVTLGGTGDDQLASVAQTIDGGYLVAGESNSGISGDKTQVNKGLIDYWIIKIDSTGNMQWDSDFGGTENDILYSMKKTSDGGFILGGISKSGISADKTQPNWDNSNSTYDYWIIKLSSSGIKQWDKVIGGTLSEPQFGNISQTIDSGYLLSGISYSQISGNKTENNLGIEQTWVVKTDSLGNVKWDKTVFTTAEDECGYAIQTNDGCYLMANNTAAGIGGDKTESNWSSFEDYWIVKFCDTTSVSTTGINSFLPLNDSKVFPNPVNIDVTIEVNNRNAAKLSCSITDVLGRKIISSQEMITTSQFTRKTDLSSLSTGIYFLIINIDGKQSTVKLVKE